MDYKRFEYLLENYDSLYCLRFGYSKIDESDIISITEANNEYSEYLDGSVYYVKEFPYYNVTLNAGGVDTKRSKDRWIVVINDPKFGPVAIRCSAIHDERSDKAWKASRYKYKIIDWKGSGFEKSSYVCINNIRKMSTIAKNRISYRGKLDPVDLHQCKVKYNEYMRNRYNNPRDFLEFIKMLEVKNTGNTSKIQDARSIYNTKTASFYDLANSAHRICEKASISNQLVYIPGGKMFCIFKERTGEWSAFRYSNDSGDIRGDIIQYNTTNPERAAKEEARSLNGSDKGMKILSDEETLKWDMLVDENKSAKEILSKIIK